MNAPVPTHVLPAFEPRLVPAAMLAALQQRFGARCSTAAAVREQHGRDESPFPVTPPEAVVFCESTDEVAAVLRLAERACGAGDPLRHRLVARRPPAGGAGRRQRRRVGA